MSDGRTALDCLILSERDQEYDYLEIEGMTVYDAETELAQLRDQAARVEALQAAVNEARETLEYIITIPPWFTDKQAIDDAVPAAHTWLAAHAPAPEEQSE